MTLRYAIGNGEYVVLRLPGAAEAMADCIEDLHFCRLGMKFLSSVPLPEFMEYALGMAREGDGGEEESVEVHGVVVQSEPAREGRWRVAIHFMADGEQAARIDRYSRSAHLQCDWCGNGDFWERGG